MTVAVTQPITLKQFLELPETKPASEYLEGTIVQKPMPKGRHSRLQAKLGAAINAVAEEPNVAYAFPELRCSFGDRSIVPDLAIFLWQRIPFTASGEVPDNFELPPDWTIEILSPEQKINRVIGNILYCLNHGAQLGWFVDPDDLSILVFQVGRQPVLCQGDNPLPVLPGIELTLTTHEVFSWLTMNPVFI